MGLHPERTACVRGWAQAQTRCATCPPAGAQPETAACVRDAEKKKTRCASCSPQARGRARLSKDTNTVRELPTAAAHPERTAGVRVWAKEQTGCANCSAQPRVLLTAGVPAAGAGVCRAFSSYLSPFPVWLFPLKLLFLCRSGRDGNFLACPLPWLCFRPAGLVTCCFFRGLLRPLLVCLPCALFWLFVHLSVLFTRVFSFVFHLFLPNFFLSKLFSFVAQAATGLYFLPKRK